MGSCCSKLAVYEQPSFRETNRLNSDYGHLSINQKKKLNSVFDEIVVDFSNPEIQDIQSAVSEMIERVKTRINERGYFTVSRIEPCGSMAEKTAMWKFDAWSEESFIEFDFLAVLESVCGKEYEVDCPECVKVKTVPVNEKYYDSFYYSHFTNEDDRDGKRSIAVQVFRQEANYSLISSCSCLTVSSDDDEDETVLYVFYFEPTSEQYQYGCDKCTIDRPTGCLRVKTQLNVGAYPAKCSFVFVWTSKAKTLFARDRLGLTTTQKLEAVTVHVDFLPALELLQPAKHGADVTRSSLLGLGLNQTRTVDQHCRFLVPKHCVVCGVPARSWLVDPGESWRKSGCLVEIDTFVNRISEQHRTCYKVVKYLFKQTVPYINSYHLKITVLHHIGSCSDASENCAECVFKLFHEFQQAYNTHELKSLHSRSNLLKIMHINTCINYSMQISRVVDNMCTLSESDSVQSFLMKLSQI